MVVSAGVMGSLPPSGPCGGPTAGGGSYGGGVLGGGAWWRGLMWWQGVYVGVLCEAKLRKWVCLI